MEKERMFPEQPISFGLNDPSLFNMKEDDTSNVSARQFAAIFGKFPSVLTTSFRGGEVDYEDALPFVKSYLESKGFEIYMQFEDSVFHNKLGEDSLKSKFNDENIEISCYAYSFINKTTRIIITYWHNRATLDCIYYIGDRDSQLFVEDFTMRYRQNITTVP